MYTTIHNITCASEKKIYKSSWWLALIRLSALWHLVHAILWECWETIWPFLYMFYIPRSEMMAFTWVCFSMCRIPASKVPVLNKRTILIILNSVIIMVKVRSWCMATQNQQSLPEIYWNRVQYCPVARPVAIII